MVVRFVTDAGVQKQGFAARFQKVSYAEKDNCVRDNHDCEQVCINIPGGYKCQCYDGYNLLSDEKSCQLLLTFESFEPEKQSDCSSNYVEILDGPSDASPVLCKVAVDAEESSPFQKCSLRDPVLSPQILYSSGTVHVEMIEFLRLFLVSRLGLLSVKQRRQNDSFVYTGRIMEFNRCALELALESCQQLHSHD
ncbi:Bone morphoproteintic protein 1 [Sparganum proliferum]